MRQRGRGARPTETDFIRGAKKNTKWEPTAAVGLRRIALPVFFSLPCLGRALFVLGLAPPFTHPPISPVQSTLCRCCSPSHPIHCTYTTPHFPPNPSSLSRRGPQRAGGLHDVREVRRGDGAVPVPVFITCIRVGLFAYIHTSLARHRGQQGPRHPPPPKKRARQKRHE